MITLYELVGAEGRSFSPYCWRTRMALAHKNLPYGTAPLRYSDIASILDGKQKTVPVIDDSGRIVGDSWAIANYLEDNYPRLPSLFGGAAGRDLTNQGEMIAFTAAGPVVAHPQPLNSVARNNCQGCSAIAHPKMPVARATHPALVTAETPNLL